MSIAVGTRLGPFRIEGLLGKGGMGEVYRAHDTRLGRDVAIKVLPAAWAGDPERVARFEREARALASLNHPNIAAVYGVEGSDGIQAIVLELIDGETLADRLARGRLPVDEAIGYARQIADALDEAHQAGIVHRDLKPANIALTATGRVKVLDFGLAKLIADPSAGAATGDTATVTAAGTRAGGVLGTAAYMSPEQARGTPVDKRTDIWAFGCVLFEMLAGRPPFSGATVTDVLAGILERHPDWTALPPATPPGVIQLVRRCLEKDPRQRQRDIGDAAVHLDAGEPLPAVVRRRPVAMPATVATVVVLAGSAAVWAPWRDTPGDSPPAVRFSVPPPDGTRFVYGPETIGLALSPDGSQLAFAAIGSGGTRAWIRPLDAEATPVPGSEGATSVFWSPDGQSLGLFADGQLKRVNLMDGTVVTVGEMPQRMDGLSGTWGADGEILFAPIDGQAISRVSIASGVAEPIVKPDPDRNEARVLWPWFLPDGRRFLYYVADSGSTRRRLMLGAAGQAAQEIGPIASNVAFVDRGFLVYARDGALLGQRFDPSAGTVSGEPFSIAPSVNYFAASGRATFSVSRSGAVAFQSHRDETRMAWFDRAGADGGTVVDSGAPNSPRISRDGRQALFDRVDPVTSFDQWVIDLERNVPRRLASAAGSERGGIFLPGGQEFFYAVAAGGAPRIYRRSLAGAGEEPVLPAGGLQAPDDVSPDGTMLVYTQRGADGRRQIWRVPVQGGEPTLFRRSTSDEGDARYSPDGRYVSFVSSESGRPEVYVTIGDGRGEPVRVSPAGGTLPRWSRDRDGKLKLFFVAADGSLMAADVQTTPGLRIGRAVRAFADVNVPRFLDFDVAPDGRFLAVVATRLSNTQPLTVISRWPGPKS
jgi:Tol biopolymer transport system component